LARKPARQQRTLIAAVSRHDRAGGAPLNTLDVVRRDRHRFSTGYGTPAKTIAGGGRAVGRCATSRPASKRGLFAGIGARRLSAIRQRYRFLYSEGPPRPTIRPR